MRAAASVAFGTAGAIAGRPRRVLGFALGAGLLVPGVALAAFLSPEGRAVLDEDGSA